MTKHITHRPPPTQNHRHNEFKDLLNMIVFRKPRWHQAGQMCHWAVSSKSRHHVSIFHWRNQKHWCYLQKVPEKETTQTFSSMCHQYQNEHEPVACLLK